MVTIDNNMIILYHTSCIGWKTLYKVAMNIKATDPFDITDKKEVAAKGAPS
jgi:hypothetical protein